MEIYDILNSACEIFEDAATLTKKSGESIELFVLPEDSQDENFQSDYPGSINTSLFSIDVSYLEIDGKTFFPEDGDVIVAEFGAGRTQRWKVIKESDSGRAWRWKWNRPGGRILIRAMKIGD